MACLEERHPQYENFVAICLTDANEKHFSSTDKSNLSYEHCQLLKASNVEKAVVQQPCMMNACDSDSSADLDLESGSLDVKKIGDISEKDCRICSNNLEVYGLEFGIPISLGCSCNGDLAFAHQKCAEKWFNIKGNKNCEICGATVKNLVGFGDINSSESSIKSGNNAATAASEAQRSCHGYRLVNCILGGILIIIALCWLLGFNSQHSGHN